MTSPIKPPGGSPPPADVGAGSVEGAKRPKTEGASETFREALDAGGQVGAPSATKAATPADLVKSISDDLRAGRTSVSEAIDRLVAQAVGGEAAQRLTPAGRRDLEAVLRSALADDPTLAAMVKDIERAR